MGRKGPACFGFGKRSHGGCSADWDPYNEAKGIVVGVGPQDEVSDKAVELGVHLAKVLEEPLELVSSWGSPPCFRALLNSWVVAWRRLANLSSAQPRRTCCGYSCSRACP